MPELRDHNRNTRAANADLLGDEATLKKPDAPAAPKLSLIHISEPTRPY